MAKINCQFHSQILDLDVSMNVILPEHTALPQNGYPTLYLLHGLSDDDSKWLRNTSIERYVEGRELAIVMPAANRSFYTNMEHGPDYFSYISEEVPEVARSFFPLSQKREDQYVGGLSMGGYGAFKMALTYPERFSAAASLSGSLDISSRIDSFPEDFANIFGNRPIQGTKDDLYFLIDQLTEDNITLPKLYQACGTEDHNYQANKEFYQYGKRSGLNIEFEEGAGGHEWEYWDQQIKRVLEFL
ncbi:alpha/beta hydrolase [Halobacillus sp. B23F22_1]|uniref:alpha/beta hydrolase n=1 Tax=Halobacillus sp. B23F22_1 TaxID=3459514 RepID=UPI00373F59E8